MGLKEARKTLCLLQQRLSSDAMSTKIFRLYLGEEGYMNEMGVYPFENLYDLRLCVRFRTTQEMLNAMRTANVFGRIVCKDDGRELAFFSPLWYNGPAELTRAEWEAMHNRRTIFDDAMANENGQATDNLPDKTHCKTQTGYNIYTLSKNNTKENINISTDELLKGFFTRLFSSEEQKKSMLGNVAEQLRKQGGLNEVQTEEAVGYFCSHQLTTYFTDREQSLRKHKYNGWIVWLRGLLNHKYANQLTAQALQEYTALLRKRTAEQARRQKAREEEERRNYHPESPFEWTERAANKRYYDDPYEGVTPIPAGAPPRPTPGCVWHPIRNVWFEGGQAL